jgi:DNA-binding response OmpR family regulator
MNADTFKILLVDDTPANLDLLVDYLTRADFEVFVAENSQSALERLRYLQPDLILLDVLLPGISGFELCRAIKANAQTRHIPVIFLTAREETADKVKGFAVGGVDYITKPLEEAEVLARVRTHLELAHTTRRLREENYKLQRHLAQQTIPAKQHAVTITSPPTVTIPTVRLTLLGAFQLVVRGEIRTSFRSDTVRALLAYLVLEGQTPLERAALASFFWPDYLPATRLNSLRVALHNLRQLLTPCDDLLTTNRKEIRFHVDPNRLWCDVLAVEAGFAADFSPAVLLSGFAVATSTPARFLPDFDTVASAPFQRWRQQKQAFYTPYGVGVIV